MSPPAAETRADSLPGVQGSGQELVALRLDRVLAELDPEPLAQLLRRRLVAAAAGDEGFHLVLDAVLAQAVRAVVEVTLDQLSSVVAALEVEVQVDLADHDAAV